ncbi:hypothetical protein Ancab_010735 [Ancistrocladus abbreviatus]
MASLMVVRAVIVAVVTVALVQEVAEAREPVLHRVGGGRETWKLGVNFTEWASTQRFYVGDWLFFGFDKHTFSALEVDKTGYEKCEEKGFITNITRGGRDVFNLTEARPYYFISGKGYCFSGMKLAIVVEDFPPQLPTERLDGSSRSDASRTMMVSPLSLKALVIAAVSSSTFLLMILLYF